MGTAMTAVTSAAMAAAMVAIATGSSFAQQAYIPEHHSTSERIFLMDCWLENGLTSNAMAACKAELARNQAEARRKEQERRQMAERSRRAQERLDALNRGDRIDPCRSGGC